MIPPFIIEQIRRREEAERARIEAEQPRLEISVDEPPMPVEPPASEDDWERGVLVIDI